MRIDLYSKCVLTVIALSLAWLAIQDTFFPRPVAAQVGLGLQRVLISGIEPGLPGALPVNVRQIGGRNLTDSTLVVRNSK